MGTYNIYGKDDIQLKVKDDQAFETFEEGQPCDLPDGVYLAPDGAVAVVNGHCHSFTGDEVKDKWGRVVELQHLPNAIADAVAEMMAGEE